MLLGDAQRHEPVPRGPEDLGDLVRILQFGAEPSARDGLLTGLHQEGVGVLARIALGDPVLGGGVLSRLDPPTAISKTSTPWRPVVSGGFVCREQYVQHYCCISRMAVL